MNKRNRTNKAIIASLLTVVVLIGAAFAYLTAQTGIINNQFKVGSSGAKLIEVFDGVRYEGKTDESDDGFADAVMTPGKTYQKEATVQFTGTGKSFAFLKITVPAETSNDTVDEFGVRSNESKRIVTLNLNADAITNNESEPDKWFKISETTYNGNTEYVYGYTTALTKNEITSSSPIRSVTIANLFISNNTTTAEDEYLVPINAYTIQLTDNNKTPTDVWNSLTK